MHYLVTAKVGAKREGVEQSGDSLIVWTRKRAHDGEANQDIIKQLSKRFHTAKSHITILRGEKSRTKTIEIYK